MSFWLDDYVRMLGVLREAGRSPRAIADFLRSPDRASTVLRHDVDRRPGQAVRMAVAEARMGVRASYYFRCDGSGRFPVPACREVADLGHEIGYHYEDLARCRGDRDRARREFTGHLEALRAIAPCVTVVMHGSPLSRFNNSDLLDERDLPRWGLIGEGILSFRALAPLYFTDAGGRWNDERVNFRDRVGVMPANVDPLVPGELRACLAAHRDRPVYVSTHPERWSKTAMQFGISVALDQGAAAIKLIVRAVAAGRGSS